MAKEQEENKEEEIMNKKDEEVLKSRLKQLGYLD